MGKRKTETMHGHPNKDSLCYCLIVGVGSHNPAFQVRKQARRRTRPRTSRGPKALVSAQGGPLERQLHHPPRKELPGYPQMATPEQTEQCLSLSTVKNTG